MILTYKYRLLPTKRQHTELIYILEQQRQLYNAALEERIGCYKKTGKTRVLFEQQKALTEWRQSDVDARKLPANLQRWTLKRLDAAFNGFFGRLKVKKGKAGFPRFKGFGQWNSFGFNEFSGIQFDGKRLRFKGMIGGIKVHLHRSLPKKANIRSCVFSKDHKGWTIVLQIEVRCRSRLSARAIGIDVGISHLATLSTGETISNIRVAKHLECKLRIKQRALSRCKRNSKRRQKVRKQVTCQYSKIKNTRRTYLHQVSRKLVDIYDLIAVEKLNIKGLAKSALAHSVYDASWGILIGMLRYKAEKAGAKLVEVDPKYTSQDCSGCGTRVTKTLSARVHICPDCGLTLDRDHNAARNILHRAVVSPEVLNVGQWFERVPRNISLEGISN
jgi:putative transposase